MEMEYGDLVRDLKGCVVMYKNKPVYVVNITGRCEVRFLDLLSQKESTVPFKLDLFDAPVRRLGFVNCLGSVVYLTRIPVRKFFMGLCQQNTKVKTIGVPYENGAAATKGRVSSFMTPEVANTIMGKFPTFVDAVQQVKDNGGAVAFDPQFAVTSLKTIFYKEEMVGRFAFTAKSVKDIQWTKGKEYLSMLLDNNHEKTVRDFQPQAA